MKRNVAYAAEFILAKKIAYVCMKKKDVSVVLHQLEDKFEQYKESVCKNIEMK